MKKKTLQQQKQKPKVNKWIYWIPRILSILLICFLALFSLDVFEESLGFWQTLLALLMHNIPVFVLAIILAISWKYEIVGGITYILAGLIFFILTIIKAINSTHSFEIIAYSFIILIPAFLIGILFLIGWWKKKKQLSPTKICYY